jgi:hypothetical protein
MGLTENLKSAGDEVWACRFAQLSVKIRPAKEAVPRTAFRQCMFRPSFRHEICEEVGLAANIMSWLATSQP